MRVPSVLAGVVAAIAAYRLGRRLAGRHAGAVASLVLASSLGVVLLTRSVGPLPLALAAMLVSSALFARAVDRGNIAWWALYAVSAALLPLTHPIAASALAAQLVALVLARHRVDLRLALPAAGIATVECGLFLVAAALDRADAPDGAGPLELADLGRASDGRSAGARCSPASPPGASCGSGAGMRAADALAGGARHGPRRDAGGLRARGRRRRCPSIPREALTTAPAALSLAAGIGLVAIGDRALRLAAIASVAAVAIAALVTAAARGAARRTGPRRRGSRALRVDGTRHRRRAPAAGGAALRHTAPGLRDEHASDAARR